MRKIVLVAVPEFDIFNFTPFTNMEETILREWMNDGDYPEEGYEDMPEEWHPEDEGESTGDDLDWDSPFAPTEEDLHEYYLRSQCEG